MTVKLHIGDLYMTSCKDELYLIVSFDDTFDAGYQRWINVIVTPLDKWDEFVLVLGKNDPTPPYDDMFTEIDIANAIKVGHWKLVSGA